MKTNIKFLTLTFFLFFQIKNINAQVFAGVDGGYLVPQLIQQNNYGFTELDYEFSGRSTFGLSVGYAGYNKHHIQTGIKFTKLGQNYSSRINEVKHQKNVKLSYIMIPVSYKIVFGDTETNSYATRAFFSVGGYFSLLNRVETNWSLDELNVEMVPFLESIDSRGNILDIAQLAGGNGLEDDKDLFESIDYGVMASFGFRTFLKEGLAFNVEFLGGYGFADVNAEAWRLNNAEGVYNPSQNVFGGIQWGLHYYFGL